MWPVITHLHGVVIVTVSREILFDVGDLSDISLLLSMKYFVYDKQFDTSNSILLGMLWKAL